MYIYVYMYICIYVYHYLLQIEFIHSQSETLMNEIRSYEQEKTEQVLKYLEELMIKKDEIDNVRVSAQSFSVIFTSGS